MEIIYVYLIIIIYLILSLIGFTLVIKRLNNLKNKHIKQTGVKGLEIGYSKLKKIISIIFIIMIISTIFIILTFL